MKIDRLTFEHFKADFLECVARAKAQRATAYGALTMRDAWDVAHHTGWSNNLYKRGFNDKHIETALKRILEA
jgi:hypothetical protein